MKKLILMMVLLLLVSVAMPAYAIQTQSANIKETKKVYTLNLDINKDEKAKNIYSSPNFQQGNQYYYGQDFNEIEKVKGKVNLNLAVDNDLNITAKGHLDINGQKYAFKNLEGKFEEKDGYLVGGVFGEANTKRAQIETAIHIILNPSNENEAQVSVTVGAMSENGNGVILFGQLNKEVILKDSNETENTTSQISYSTASDATYSIAASADSTQNYRLSTYGTYLAEGSTTTPPGSGYVSTGNYVLGIDVFDRDPKANASSTGTLTARLWSKTTNVDSYAKSKYGYSGVPDFGVDLATITFYEFDKSSTIDVREDAINPMPTATSDTGIVWDWISFISSANKYTSVVANATKTAYSTYRFFSGNQITITALNNGNAREYGATVNVKSLNDKIDYSGTTITNTKDASSGGLTATFDYEEYATGTETLAVDSRIRYLGYVGYYIYLFTQKYTTKWNADFNM